MKTNVYVVTQHGKNGDDSWVDSTWTKFEDAQKHVLETMEAHAPLNESFVVITNTTTETTLSSPSNQWNKTFYKNNDKTAPRKFRKMS